MEDEYPSILKIQMLGGFSLSWNGREITDSDNRSRKVWLLLAYMICCRSHSIPQNELFGLLWGDEGTTNPINALKTMFHRVRTMLDGLGGGAGHTLIVRREGSYTWNEAISISVDVEEFEALCQSAAAQTDPQALLKLCLDALELYRGDFLQRLSSEPWVIPQSTYFHNLYLRTLRSVLPLLREQQRQSDIVALCNRAVLVEPYDEGLYQFLMRAQLDLEDQQGVIRTYEAMSELLYANFGIMPADESKAIYREAIRTVNERSMNLGLLREQLEETSVTSGALLCDYDFFRIIYQAEARAVARNGDAVHIALLSAVGDESKPLSRRSLDCCMDNLQDVIVENLRKGDVVSRCSVSQYILMLPQANYENSCMVCDRIIRAFARQYPHSPATLSYTVQPLVPNT
ncbi:BTAD domain-containing putative transcriptional regulator [Oscillibacter sp.]|uniref:AfsR/SARP family transcriptional regulator n=1 Tax=Oscillibacter sp. TaxID=1945593 RepID=UPI003392F509